MSARHQRTDEDEDWEEQIATAVTRTNVSELWFCCPDDLKKCSWGQVSKAVAATGAALSEGRGQGFFDPLGPGVFCAPPPHPTPITHYDFPVPP